MIQKIRADGKRAWKTKVSQMWSAHARVPVSDHRNTPTTLVQIERNRKKGLVLATAGHTIRATKEEARVLGGGK